MLEMDFDNLRDLVYEIQELHPNKELCRILIHTLFFAGDDVKELYILQTQKNK